MRNPSSSPPAFCGSYVQAAHTKQRAHQGEDTPLATKPPRPSRSSVLPDEAVVGCGSMSSAKASVMPL